ncbi:hypothetical protein SAMCCGM7_pC0167 (plasmid) [Sinorhizobium americanum CCGM7]|nr:hypothetical protein SAMCCGM7_pC0167 [Sinorhizobium americanum CCGM7]
MNVLIGERRQGPSRAVGHRRASPDLQLNGVFSIGSKGMA